LLECTKNSVLLEMYVVEVIFFFASHFVSNKTGTEIFKNLVLGPMGEGHPAVGQVDNRQLGSLGVCSMAAKIKSQRAADTDRGKYKDGHNQQDDDVIVKSVVALTF